MIEPFAEIVVDENKLRDYVLNDAHPRGRHKARVFLSRLGLTAGDSPWLARTLRDAASFNHGQLELTEVDEYGRRYRLDFQATNAKGSARVRSAWIVRTGENRLSFVTCFLL